ncbi:hypothetical protein NGR_b00630 (plasmid) [Sinorhizobium fredii NGR234]|uniref:Uncharacterized protein n=2 Tax=Rhizobium fredii TaxID=380 RepID=C3KMW1_SINFN|nr:hypothetical protein NGR_b00630 [Sinorhizobium fredii NGR234]
MILGAGLAGMTAAPELSAAGYLVVALEYPEQAGGRNWTLAARTPELGGPEGSGSLKATISILLGGESLITTTACSITVAAECGARTLHQGQ